MEEDRKAFDNSMKEEQGTFKLAMMPGLIVGIVSVGMSLVLWATVSDIKIQQYLGYLTWFVLAILYYKYTINFREEHRNGHLSYGQSLGFQVSMSVVLSLVNSIYSYLLFAVLDPNLIEKAKEIAAENLYAQNMPEDQIEVAMKYQEMFMTPAAMTFFAIFGTFLFGFIISLIVSFFTKKEANLFDN